MTKEAIRQQMLRARREMSEEDRSERSRRAQAAILSLDEYRCAKSIMLYYPIGGEVQTALIAEDALSSGKRVIYPVTDRESGRITPTEASRNTRFEVGGFGVHEPCGKAYEGDIDLVIVPGVAFDREGGRLGFGKGCYDGFLAGVGAVRVGLCSGLQLTDGLPTEEHDVSMDMIVPENEVIRIKKNA